MTVTVYSTPTCPYCKQLKEFLGEKGVEFEDVDVAADQARAKEMIDKSGQMGVPVTVIAKDDGEEKLIVGFDQKEVMDALGIE